MKMRVCARKGCNKEFEKGVGRRKHMRYCSQACKGLAYKHRHGIHRPRELKCKNGHKRTPENTKICANGTKRCKICLLQYGRKRYAPTKARNKAKRKYWGAGARGPLVVNPETAEASREQQREKYRKHAEQRAAKSRQYYREHREEQIAKAIERQRRRRSRLAVEKEQATYRNYDFRARELELAKATASEELLRLIEEQEKDSQRFIITKPWERSLHEPIYEDLLLIDTIAA